MPGPSQSLSAQATAPQARLAVLAIGWVLLALAISANFVFATAVTPRIADPALVVAGALATAVLLLIMGGIPRRAALARLGSRGIAACLAAGALAAAAAPALIATSRYTDSPPGSVAAFWTTAVTGAVLVAAFALPRGGFVRIAAAMLAVVGAAGVLGNWERPSSFSLFILHTDQEIALFAAGLALTAAVLVASRVARAHGSSAVYSLVGVGGLLGALAWALPASSWDVAGLLAPSIVLPAATTQALVVALTLYLAFRTGSHLPGAAFLVAVPLISSLLFIEEATGVFGPRPILIEAATWASGVMVLGAAIVLLPSRSGARSTAQGRPVRVAAIALATITILVALVAFSLPGVDVAVRGTTHAGQEFAADFTMRGFQTVGGWLAFAIGLLGLALAVERRPAPFAPLASLLAAAMAAGAYLQVRYTPLHVWMTWIPPEVQQDYGSEYATIVFTPVPTPVQVAALAIACSAIALLSVGRMLAARDVNDDPRQGAGGQDR